MKDDDFKLSGCFAFWLTDGWTFVIVEWLLQLKKNIQPKLRVLLPIFCFWASYNAHLTNLVSATANFCFLGSLAELAKIVTSWNMTNSTNNLVQKFKVNPSSATANFLFFRYLWLSTLKIWQTVPITCCKNFGSIWTKFWVLRPIFCFWSN